MKKLVQGVLLSSITEVTKLNEYSIDDDENCFGLDCQVTCHTKNLNQVVRLICMLSHVQNIVFKLREDID